MLLFIQSDHTYSTPSLLCLIFSGVIASSSVDVNRILVTLRVLFIVPNFRCRTWNVRGRNPTPVTVPRLPLRRSLHRRRCRCRPRLRPAPSRPRAARPHRGREHAGHAARDAAQLKTLINLIHLYELHFVLHFSQLCFIYCLPNAINKFNCILQHHSHHEPHLYNYSEEVDEDLMCQICLQPFVQPVDTPCCHTFCHACINSYLKVTHLAWNEEEMKDLLNIFFCTLGEPDVPARPETRQRDDYLSVELGLEKVGKRDRES